MKIKLQKTWTIERTFEYEIDNADFKKTYKTQKDFKNQFFENQDKIINQLNKLECTNVVDVEAEGTFSLALVK